jgi:hypothetical protein
LAQPKELSARKRLGTDVLFSSSIICDGEACGWVSD